MKRTVLITGKNSFIASHLAEHLKSEFEIRFLTRTPKSPNEFGWNVQDRTIDDEAIEGVDYIVHLAGAKLNDGTPLTEERKTLIRDTRIGAADFLREKLKARQIKIKAFVSASAIGYYDYTDSTLEIDENGERATDFNGDLCRDWEHAADKFKEENVAEHVSKIRVSLTLGRDGGIFPIYRKMVKDNPQIALQVNAGYYPWNHVEDMAGIFAFAVKHELDGVYNSVAPQPASMRDILKAIANNISNTNHAITPFTGQHLIAHKIVNAGYRFKYPNIELAVADILSGK